MMNRKQIKSVLREWQTFLHEQNEKASAGPVVRIFDFDGTLIVYEDPEVNLIMKNPYMASFINTAVMEKLNKKYATLPKNMKDILKDTGPRVKNYIISKVSSAGFPKVKVEKLIAGLQNIEAKGDKNFEALAKVVIEPAVPNWKALLASGKTDELISKAASVLNVESSDMPDSGRLSAQTSVMTQEEKIDQVLNRFKIDDKFARVYTKDNIAQTQEVPIDGGGTRVQQIAGTSGKFSPASTIAKNAFAEFPDSIVTFEIYDNSTSNVAEIESAILKASSGDQEEVEAKSEEGMLRSLADELGRRENVSIKKFQAVATESGFELRDLAGTHISKTKNRGVEGVQESGPRLKFQKIKNKFFNLMNFLKKGGSAGRPSKVTMEALEKAVNENTGYIVQELFANTVSAIATTGLEEKYSSKTALDELVEQVYEFVTNYKTFKEAFEANKSGVPTKPAKAPKAAATKKPVAPQDTGDEEPFDQAAAADADAQNDDFYSREGDDEYGDDDLRESLNRFKKALKKLL